MRRVVKFLCCVFILVGSQILKAHAQSSNVAKLPALVVDSLVGEVRVAATFQPRNFSGLLGGLIGFVPNYHFLVWGDGRASHEALFVTLVSDSQLVAALVKIGARPGNNLSLDAWDKRHDPKHPAPQTRIAGTPVSVGILWEDQKDEIDISDLLDDSGGKGFGFRFGGNLQHQHHWHSGCVICLYSCPGSKVGNAAYTVRDYVTHKTLFKLKKGKWPVAGTKSMIILRVRK
jgi:hypothetical protein